MKTVKQFTIFKEGVTKGEVIIVSKQGEPFDLNEKIKFYESLGYTVKKLSK